VTFNADERFAYCSTFKALATGLLLKQDTVETGMTLRAVMIAALEISDNTAANLLLKQLVPHEMQDALRRLGDNTTDVDRDEPDLNNATPGYTRDTSTARALSADLRDLLLGDVLPASRRQLLTGWMLANTTGGPTSGRGYRRDGRSPTRPATATGAPAMT
jgi:beta-lactamase class A